VTDEEIKAAIEAEKARIERQQKLIAAARLASIMRGDDWADE
jgi:hypothetical protein